MNEKKRRRISWDDLAAFLAVAQAGGLSGAAREAGSSAPTLGRRMHALERQMATELFVRRSHGYDLTDAGQSLKRELESVAGRIERITRQEDREQLPLVKVSAGTWTALLMARHVSDLAGEPADTRIKFVASEDIMSINRREAAICIRNRRPSEACLASRRLVQVRFAGYATTYAPSDWISVNANTPSARWLASQAGQCLLHDVNSPRLALDMALAGAGRIVLPTFVGDAEESLDKVVPDIPELTHDQWLVTHDSDRSLPEVRRILNRIAKLLSK